MLKYFALVFIAVSLISFINGSAVNVSAAHVTDELELKNSITIESPKKDYSQLWYTEIINSYESKCIEYGGAYCTDEQKARDMINGSWAVTKSSDEYGIYVHWSTDEEQDLVFETSTGQPAQHESWIYPEPEHEVCRVSIAYYGASEPGTTTEGTYVSDLECSAYRYGLTDEGGFWSFFLSTFNPIYPSGYEGDLIPDTYTPPAEPLEWTPDINMVNVVDWKITLQDKNFNTFDNVPFTCKDGLTPVIEYDLYNNDTDPISNISQGAISPTIPFVFQSENYGVNTEYKFIGNYYCGNDEGQPTFSGQTTYYFNVNSAGAYVAPTVSCYQDSFPYIDMNGCTGVIENLLNNLSFGAISLPSWSIDNNSCHTLGMMGDWINVPAHSRTICPQFSEQVRNTVTPFLTLVLGLTIMGVLTTKTRRDNN